jgi:hypothetical protein
MGSLPCENVAAHGTEEAHASGNTFFFLSYNPMELSDAGKNIVAPAAWGRMSNQASALSRGWGYDVLLGRLTPLASLFRKLFGIRLFASSR